jgi:hypothetical protein
MCQACETGEQRQAGINPALAARARRIEATMPGSKVPIQSWEILLGRIGGAVPWADTQRMLECLELAVRKGGSGLRCDAA